MANKSLKRTFFYNVAIQVKRQLVTANTEEFALALCSALLSRERRSSIPFLAAALKPTFEPYIKIRLRPSWGFMLCASCMITRSVTTPWRKPAGLGELLLIVGEITGGQRLSRPSPAHSCGSLPQQGCAAGPAQCNAGVSEWDLYPRVSQTAALG